MKKRGFMIHIMQVCYFIKIFFTNFKMMKSTAKMNCGNYVKEKLIFLIIFGMITKKQRDINEVTY